jgi:hypothetical protein
MNIDPSQAPFEGYIFYALGSSGGIYQMAQSPFIA